MKHAAIVLAVAMGLLAAGCQKAADSSGGAKGRKLTIGVSIPAADHGWTAGVGYWAKVAMDMHPEVNWVYATADKPDKQIADIKDMMQHQKLDGLVVLATESAPLTPVAEEASRNGIYIVNVDRGFLKPVADVFIEGDNEAFGRKSAEFMVQKLGGKGKIVILRGIPCTVDTDRFNAAMAVFKKHPEIEILGEPQPGYWNRTKALEVMQGYLAQHKKIDAVWAQDDDMALGCEQAISGAQRKGEMWMLGGAGMKDIVKRVGDRDAMYPADITYPPSMIAVGIHMAVSNLRDGKEKQLSPFMPRHIKLDVDLVTPENARQFYFPESVY
jgi:ribose transport system substrate-binding protein